MCVVSGVNFFFSFWLSFVGQVGLVTHSFYSCGLYEGAPGGVRAAKYESNRESMKGPPPPPP
jgi:hypothetical protein